MSSTTHARRKICLHCQRPDRPVNRPRSLCWECYYTPGVKDRYPAMANQYGTPRRSDAETAAELERLVESRLATMPGRGRESH